jgi:hypothetical protein
VKWGVLLELCRRFDAIRILQVLYYRPSDWKELEIDGAPTPLPKAVIEHFRNVANVRTLQTEAHLDIIDAPFHDRTEYMEHILAAIQSLPQGVCIVFLDPDTGLESKSPGPEHVLETELRRIWQEMRAGDMLVLYQHQTNMAGVPWVEPKRLQLEQALGLSLGAAKVASAPKIARDVAFFFCRKDDQLRTAQAANRSNPRAYRG